VWLNSIRKLNPVEGDENLPVFMQTTAWHQEKMNTQLASWSQLRHDNLLYAKQSYTGGTGCSFPYSFIEPYPEFFRNIRIFAENAGNFFGSFPVGGERMNQVTRFFRNFADVNGKLEILAGKELAGESFTPDEIDWLQSMLFIGGMSGEPPYSGWYSSLYFDKWAASEDDFTVVDVHTQPTDFFGNVVGRVLHTGTGMVNLGLFIAGCPGSNSPMAFIGPVMSYYQTITRDFERMTDQEWKELVWDELMPARPDWTNIYLADKFGEEKSAGAELPSRLYTGTSGDLVKPGQLIVNVFPNPFDNRFSVQLYLDENTNASISLYNSTGVLIHQVSQNEFVKGFSIVEVGAGHLPPGLYFLKTEIDGIESHTVKLIKK